MEKQINLNALIKKVVLQFVMFFLPAATIKYWEAWVYMAILVIPMINLLFYLIKHDL